ncbi:nicotinamide-nucleotide adenylyltransferase, NadR type [Desulfatibacillum alkenivorans DSM 16219]|jgi:NadR type nicotinamide-nucleotide adenylyltransferase|uniref:Nicotinamide-nucleotide adenylyltransferase, NadR type n=1 Tax=Desulfatibacillum alkenivorans DSM 16219 TaxID=1121393 RepID=A0A1M6JZS4_9BACT|nr:AAA family ATPase [Desulfatibacillum alkenivorans]SHJ52211.1 nicotinamide-nucleotide adenylyltransferase, NadR type [Desulfatibacillum alkenivorans DSM 16219]
MKKTGLTLGKFAPFHKGHQFLIETALREVNELFVLVYETGLMDVPLQVRANWIRKLYPQARVIEAWGGPPGYGSSPEIVKKQNDYILSVIGDEIISCFFSGEFYGEHVSKVLGAIDRRIDPERKILPVSGTQIRQDFFANRKFVDPLVYRDLVTWVCFMGAPSTGKTTLVQALAEKYQTVYMTEYGGEYWRENHVDRRITLDQFEEIPLEHMRREDALVRDANQYLFCDTNPITTYVFAKDYHGESGPVLEKAARGSESRYDLFFLCDTDIPYADTWDRSGDVKRQWFQNQIIGDLAERRLPYFVLRGSVEERIAQVEHVLSRHKKFGNLTELFTEPAT